MKWLDLLSSGGCWFLSFLAQCNESARRADQRSYMFKNAMRPVHPGEILLEDYINPQGISVNALSKALHVPYSRLREVVDGNRGVTADTALRLERYFGSEAQGWLNLQTAYDLRIAEKAVGKSIDKQVLPMVPA